MSCVVEPPEIFDEGASNSQQTVQTGTVVNVSHEEKPAEASLFSQCMYYYFQKCNNFIDMMRMNENPQKQQKITHHRRFDNT